jgi:hypothetical protein
VRNWFDGKNGPSGENLVSLMHHSDAVLSTVLDLAERPPPNKEGGLADIRRQLVDAVARIDGLDRRS